MMTLLNSNKLTAYEKEDETNEYDKNTEKEITIQELKKKKIRILELDLENQILRGRIMYSKNKKKIVQLIRF